MEKFNIKRFTACTDAELVCFGLIFFFGERPQRYIKETFVLSLIIN